MGFFYDRFQIQDLMNLEQYSGTANSQKQTVITNPTCFDASSLTTALKQGCGSTAASTSQIYSIAPSYRAPYTEQYGASLERQLTKSSTLTFTYLRSFGVHQLVVRDANAYAPLPGTVYYNSSTGARPDSNLGIVDQYFPEAVFKQNQIIVNIRAQFTRNFSMMGFYNWTDANSDGGAGSNPSNSYDLGLDYGRASFVRPQMVFLMGSYNGPWGLSFNPFLVAQSGRPFNITTATDLTGDNFFNDRPSYAASSSACAAGAGASQYALTSFGCLDTNSKAGETLVPSDVAVGPSNVAVNLRLSRAWGIGPKVESSGGPPPGDGGMRGGGGGERGGGGRGGFGGGFGGFGGGGGGGMRGGMSNTGRKYSLTFSAQALNLFNDINLGTPSGTVVPAFNPTTGITGPGSRFDVSNHLASGMFASPSGSAARRIFLQAAFTF
jgi:uncharacterized membrane protein YgcG